MATQEQRSETTRLALLKAFKASFLKHGFDRTTTQHVLAETGLSKGALYHHFQSKAEVAEALYEEESRSAIARALENVDATAPPLIRLRDACLAWTKEVRSPNVSRMLFEIGPAALGQQRAKEIEDEISLKQIERLLQEAIDVHDMQIEDPKLTAAFLNAMVAEAALYTLRTKTDATPTLEATFNAIFDSLRTR